jgi:HD-like signal output (HDOD) protein
MERIIERDPAITAKIMRVSNSAYYGLTQVPTIGRAISILGLNVIRSLVVGVAYQQAMAARTSSGQFNKLQFWRHSLGVAAAARIIAKLKMPMKAEELYCAGMMHDIGLLVMDKFCPQDLDRAIKKARMDHVPLCVAEQEVLGFDHAQIGGMVAEKWGLSPLLQHAMKFHHDLDMDDEHRATTAFVAAADYLAHMGGLTNNTPDVGLEMPEWLIDEVGIAEDQFKIIQDVMIAEVQRAEEAFQIR